MFLVFRNASIYNTNDLGYILPPFPHPPIRLSTPGTIPSSSHPVSAEQPLGRSPTAGSQPVDTKVNYSYHPQEIEDRVPVAPSPEP